MNTVQTAQVNTLIADLKPRFPERGFMGPCGYRGWVWKEKGKRGSVEAQKA